MSESAKSAVLAFIAALAAAGCSRGDGAESGGAESPRELRAVPVATVEAAPREVV